MFSEHGDAFGSFALSFVVIWVLWTAHHRTMEYFDAYDAVLFRLTMIWLFTIVLLPFVTQLLTGSQYDRGATPLYEGVLLVSSLCLTAMSWWGRRHRELLADDPEADRWVTEPVAIGGADRPADQPGPHAGVPEHRRVPAVPAAGRRQRHRPAWLRRRRRRQPG